MMLIVKSCIILKILRNYHHIYFIIIKIYCGVNNIAYSKYLSATTGSKYLVYGFKCKRAAAHHTSPDFGTIFNACLT